MTKITASINRGTPQYPVPVHRFQNLRNVIMVSAPQLSCGELPPV